MSVAAFQGSTCLDEDPGQEKRRELEFDKIGIENDRQPGFISGIAGGWVNPGLGSAQGIPVLFG